MMRRLAPILVVVLVALLAGCDGGNDEATTQPPPTTTSSETGRAALEGGVRRALRENDRLSSYVLATNRVPTWATRSTRGPALEALRRSAADRRKRGIRVRTLENKLMIASIRLDPSYTRASAVVRSIQRVRPYRGSKAMGQAVKLDEKARVELHRLGATGRFVVWRVRVLG
jgi:hypothetical protein